jgi:hypothetical protein
VNTPMLSCVPLLCPAISATSRPVENRNVWTRPNAEIDDGYDANVCSVLRNCMCMSRGMTKRCLANSYQSLGRNYWLRLQDNLPQDRGKTFLWNFRTFLLLHVVSHHGTSLSSGEITLINSCIGYYNKRNKMLSTQPSQNNWLF